MPLRPRSGGVTAKRSIVAIVGVLAVAILATLPRAPNGQDVARGYPPSPSAAEESGISEPAGMRESQVRPVSPRVHRPRTKVPSGHPSASAGRDSHLTNPTTRHDVSPSDGGIAEDSVVWPGGPSGLVVLPLRNMEFRHGGEAGVEEGQVTVPVARNGPPVTTRTPLLTPPVLLSEGSLRYPDEAYRIVVDHSASSGVGIDAAEGRVGLKILVHADGSIGGVEVVQPSGRPFLDAAAVREVARWKFAPATRDGQPIDAWALVPLLFVLR